MFQIFSVHSAFHNVWFTSAHKTETVFNITLLTLLGAHKKTDLPNDCEVFKFSNPNHQVIILFLSLFLQL